MVSYFSRFARAAISVIWLGVLSSVHASESRIEAEPQDLVIVGATLIDGTGRSPYAATVVVRDSRILAIETEAEPELPAAAKVIDASGKYFIPGLADMHVHLSRDLPQPRLDDETEAVLARNLYYGVTSILALGASDASTQAILSHRARRAAGELQSPYIYGTGGHLTLQGTHPVYTAFPPGIQQKVDELADNTPMDEPVNLYSLGIGLSIVRIEEAARKAVRERAEGGMDAIKITVESGPTPFGDVHPQMSVPMIRAIVDEAATHDLRVFAHVTSLDELQATFEGGAAGVVHTVWERLLPGVDLAERLAAKHFYVVPTTSIYRGTVALHYIDEPLDLNDPFLRETVSAKEVAILRNPDVIARFRSRWDRPLASAEDRKDSIKRRVADLLSDVGMLFEQAVPIALGTDTGNMFTFHGYSVHDELEHLVRAGLTLAEALAAATKTAAELLDATDDFGTIELGKRADLLILGANSLNYIRNTRTLESVIAEGRLIDRDALPVQAE